MRNKLSIDDDYKYLIGEFHPNLKLSKESKMSRKSYDAATIVVLIVLGVPLVVGISALSGWILMLLWNWALVGVFPSVPVLDFWKAWGLSLLLSFVGGFFRSSSSN